MNKIFLFTIFMLIVVNPAFAEYVVQRNTYSNGMEVSICDINGRIFYCTEQDRLNSAELQKNPNISIVEQVTIRQPGDSNFSEKCKQTQNQIQSGTNLLYSVIDLARVIKGLTGVQW